MIDLTQILQAIRQVRPDLLQRILGGGMQSMTGGGLQAPPNYQAMPMPEISMPRPMPMPEVSRPEAWVSQFPGARGSIPTSIVDSAPGGGGPRSSPASFGMDPSQRPSLPGGPQRVPQWMQDADAMPFPGRRPTTVRPRPRPGRQVPGGRGDSIQPRPRPRPRPRPGGRGGMVPYGR